MRKTNIVPYEHVSFNADWAAAQTLEQFTEHEKHNGLSPEQLKEAFDLCKTAVAKASPKPAPVAAQTAQGKEAAKETVK